MTYEKKYRVTWKKIGAAKVTESIRSIIPPWPSIMWPQSLAPRLRLTADSASPPSAPQTTISADISADCSGVNGVIHHSAVPMPTAARPPPTRPSTVFDGLTVRRSEEHTSELQSIMRISYAVFCLKQ